MWNRFREIVRFRVIGSDFAKSYDFAKSLTQNRNREKNDFAKSLTPKPKSRNQWNDSKTNNIVSILSKIFTISYLFCREIQKLFSSLWAMFSIQMYLPRSSLYSRTVEKVGTVGTSTVRVQYWIFCTVPVRCSYVPVQYSRNEPRQHLVKGCEGPRPALANTLAYAAPRAGAGNMPRNRAADFGPVCGVSGGTASSEWSSRRGHSHG